MAQRASLQAVRPNRVPPHNMDAEQSVLGAMLESREAIANVIEIIKAEDFYKPSHAEIYETILALFAKGEAPDAITVADELGRRGTLEGVGGKPYLLGLLEAYPTASSAAHYARIVEEHAQLRALIDAGNRVQELGFAMPEDVSEAIDSAEEIIYQVGDRRLREDLHAIRGLLTENMESIERLYERGESITGLSTGFPDLDEMTSGFQPNNLIIVAARPSMGKCLSAGTTIDDPQTGERLELSDFVARQRPQVMSIRNDGRVTSTDVTDWIPNGRRHCWSLTTRTGRTIEATANHPFLTVDGWVPLASLSAGMKVATPRVLSVFGTRADWSYERARLLGYFIGDGGLTETPPRFTNVDDGIVDDFKLCVSKEFPRCKVRGPIRITYSASGSKGKPNPITSWLTDLAVMGKKSEDKRIPGVVWTLPKRHLAEFLRALFSCDATVYSMSGYPRIEFTVASRHLAEDVQHALCRFGIVAKLWKKKVKFQGNAFDSWRVEITDPASVDVYQQDIGWIGEKARRTFVRLRNRRPHSNCGHVPKEAWKYVRKALGASGMSLGELGRRAGEKGWTNHTNRTIPQRRLRRYAEILGDRDLQWLASEDLYWDEIVSIEPVGEREVYDVTVPDGSNFVANDFCVHNSSLLNDFALHAATRVGQPVVIFSLEMSRNELVQRFLSSEARVDSQRLRKGTLQEQDWTRLSSALGRLAEAPIFIDDSANSTLMEMRAKCRRIKAKHGLGLVIIDYLQLMASPRRSENRQQEVSEISRNLKVMARELEVPVICASQLNRQLEYRGDKRPMLADLRESGAIEQDSDLVMLLYRDEVYNPDTSAKGEAELIVAKHRNGPTGKVRLAFMNQYTKFASIAKGPGF